MRQNVYGDQHPPSAPATYVARAAHPGHIPRRRSTQGEAIVEGDIVRVQVDMSQIQNVPTSSKPLGHHSHYGAITAPLMKSRQSVNLWGHHSPSTVQ